MKRGPFRFPGSRAEPESVRIAPMQTASNRTLSRIVQSRQNSRVKELRAGLSRGTQNEQGRVAIEGEHLLEEALRSGLAVHTVFVRSGSGGALGADAATVRRCVERGGARIAGGGVFERRSTESPQGLAALVEVPAFSWEDAIRGKSPLLVIAAGLQDPGNFGTLLRSAEAFGASGVISLPGTVSRWNAKALRASSGSAFRIPVIVAAEEEMQTKLREQGIRLLAATVDGGTNASEIDLQVPSALLIGNEGAGLPEKLVKLADERITIPCPGPVESLNAAVAASVLLYEAARQRSKMMGSHRGSRRDELVWSHSGDQARCRGPWCAAGGAHASAHAR